MTDTTRRSIIEHAMRGVIEKGGSAPYEMSFVIEQAINEFESQVQSPAESDWLTGLHEALIEAKQKVSNADQIGALTAIHQAQSLLPPVRPKPDALRGSAKGFFARLVQRRSA